MLLPREEVSVDLRVPRDDFLARLRLGCFSFSGFEGEGRWPAFVVPPVMFLFGLLMPRLGWSLGGADRKQIMATLSRAAGQATEPAGD